MPNREGETRWQKSARLIYRSMPLFKADRYNYLRSPSPRSARSVVDPVKDTPQNIAAYQADSSEDQADPQRCQQCRLQIEPRENRKCDAPGDDNPSSHICDGLDKTVTPRLHSTGRPFRPAPVRRCSSPGVDCCVVSLRCASSSVHDAGRLR